MEALNYVCLHCRYYLLSLFSVNYCYHLKSNKQVELAMSRYYKLAELINL